MKRGDVVLVDWPYSDRTGSKLRPAIVVQADFLTGLIDDNHSRFVHYILERATADSLTKLRLVVVGAEKCPPTLFERCRQAAPKATILEGIGITECAPVVSVNPPAQPKPGSIGKPLRGVTVRVVDLDEATVLPAGRMGMMQVSGPTVFPGYLGYEGLSPFVEDEGKRWYVTGDLGELDEDGYVWFRGRLVTVQPTVSSLGAESPLR